jgi:hypothetical protein
MRNQEQWQSLLADFQRSSLSQYAFCKERGLTASSFSKWRKKLETQSDQALFVDLGTMPADRDSADDHAAASADWQVELKLGKGVILRVRAA